MNTETKNAANDSLSDRKIIDRGCNSPMKDDEFASLKNALAAKLFEDAKIELVKKALAGNCVSSQQVHELLPLVTFEDSKLQIAKFAYERTIDKENYLIINDAFTFESSATEMNEFIKSLKQ